MLQVITRLTGSSTSGDKIPDRVRIAIAKQQDAAERLIAWIQCGIIVTFGILYTISPKTSEIDPWMTPVGISLVAYFAFSILRVWLAYSIRLPAWFLALSVAADLALLMMLIWSFHIQYDQPASFYLKVPTLLYVFIFIALRALRFEARYVLLAGLVSTIGWLALVFYAVSIDPQGNAITRDYVAYMTSNAILLGAEFDKVISILMVTGILCVTLTRARKLLERSVIEATAAADLARFFSPEIASKITHSDQQIQPGQGEAREAAILNVDIRGFTKMANNMDPTNLIQLLHEYESRMVPIIQDHGGNIDKFLGDGILATFGAVLSSERYAADAMRTVDALIDAADTWNADRSTIGLPPISVGMAVVTGRIIFGAVGDDTRLEYTVIGEPVNLCAKLEKHNRTALSRALTTCEASDLAERQGYQAPSTRERFAAVTVEGVPTGLDLVVIASR